MKGDVDRAIADLNEAIKIDPNFALAYYNRAIAYGLKGDIDRAIADFDLALKFELGRSARLQQPRLCLPQQGRQRQARHRRLRPGDQDSTRPIPIAFANRGDIYYTKKEFDRAISDYEQAIKINPNFASAYNHRGLALDEKRDCATAIKDFDRRDQAQSQQPVLFQQPRHRLPQEWRFRQGHRRLHPVDQAQA